MDNAALILSNKPLPENQTTITRYIITETEVVRGEHSFESKNPEKQADGKITFNTDSFRIFSLPARESTAAQPLLTVDRNRWDLFLVWMPFTLHDTVSRNVYYEKATFHVTLSNQRAIAFDLFPRNVTRKIEETRTYTLSPQIKFQEVEMSLGQMQREIRFDGLHPTIRAFGEGEHSFYWVYTGFAEQKAVIPETKHALVVLQVPRGTRTVEGEIRYEVVVIRKRLGEWRSKTCNPSPYRFHWNLDDATPLFIEAAPRSPQTTMAAPSVTSVTVEQLPTPASPLTDHFDACVVCALAEEAEAFTKEVEQFSHVTFQQAFSPRTRRAYRHSTITNTRGEALSIQVSWLPGYGPLETGLHLRPLLEEYRPCFVAMTGICAGDRRKVKLGDIIVAERAFSYDTGKIVSDSSGQAELLRDTDTQHPHPAVLHFVRMFDGWQSALATLPRPTSHHQQRDWLLQSLLNPKTPRIDDLDAQTLARYAPDWREIVQALQSGPHPYLTQERTLLNPARINDLRFGSEAFPYQDPAEPALYLAPMASGNSVRADNPFDTIRLPVRGTVAIDMEGAAFYRTVAEFPTIPSLLVKAVSDYADREKDDSYHEYSSRASARYMLHFIRAYVTSR